jgi:DNA-binding beta-propeller fold protein YncE
MNMRKIMSYLIGLCLFSFSALSAQPYVYVSASPQIIQYNTNDNTQALLTNVGVASWGQSVTNSTRDTLYVIDVGNGSDPGSVVVVDLTVNPPAVSSTITVGVSPVGIAITPDDAKLFVTNFNDGTVSAITIAGPIVNSIPVGTGSGSAPFGVAISGTTAFVVLQSDKAVIPINTTTEIAGTSFSIPSVTPALIAIDPTGTFGYVTDRGGNNVIAFDLAGLPTPTLTSIPVGDVSLGIDITSDGAQAYVTQQGFTNRVAVLDLTTTPPGSVSPPKIMAGSNPFGVTFSVDDATAYVANVSSINLTIITVADRSTVSVALDGVMAPTFISVSEFPAGPVGPTVTGLDPTFGPPAGGTSVEITGTGFTVGSTVDFGANPATSVSFNSATSLTAVSPAGVGVVDVIVTTGALSSAPNASSKFTYTLIPPPVTVTALNPNSGSEAGGTSVEITGTGFDSSSTVKFGLASSLDVTFNSATSLTAISPPGAGVVNVIVTTGTDSSAPSSASQYTYTPAPPPTVTGLNPSSGPEAGGTSVDITGTDFTAGATVAFGANPATGVVVNSPTSITATSPAGTGTVDVIVTTGAGPSAPSAASKFTYEGTPPPPPPGEIPTVTALNPSSGPPAGGTVVQITGTGFTEGATVSFGENEATDVKVNSATSITATSPKGTGVVDVIVSTDAGDSEPSAGSKFTYVLAAPVLTSINPPSGPAGSPVILTGTGFTGATAVTFGGVPVSAGFFVVNSDTSITVIVPPGTGTVAVVVINSTGTSNQVMFTYTASLVGNILPPRHLRGCQFKRPGTKNLVNTITFKAPRKGAKPVAYAIYRNQELTDLAAIIKPGCRLQFKDRNRVCGVRYSYYVISIDASGAQSTPVSVTVPRR